MYQLEQGRELFLHMRLQFEHGRDPCAIWIEIIFIVAMAYMYSSCTQKASGPVVSICSPLC